MAGIEIDLIWVGLWAGVGFFTFKYPFLKRMFRDFDDVVTYALILFSFQFSQNFAIEIANEILTSIACLIAYLFTANLGRIQQFGIKNIANPRLAIGRLVAYGVILMLFLDII